MVLVTLARAVLLTELKNDAPKQRNLDSGTKIEHRLLKAQDCFVIVRSHHQLQCQSQVELGQIVDVDVSKKYFSFCSSRG